MRTFMFDHVWRLPFPEAVVYDALAQVDAYAEWWPQVRRTQRIDAESGHAHVRSLLPYTLDLVLRREVEDAAGRVLRVAISGDLEGWSEWRLETTGLGSTVARYAQEARVMTRGLGRLVPLVAPVLRANHTWMMRSGERGLVRHLDR